MLIKGNNHIESEPKAQDIVENISQRQRKIIQHSMSSNAFSEDSDSDNENHVQKCHTDSSDSDTEINVRKSQTEDNGDLHLDFGKLKLSHTSDEENYEAILVPKGPITTKEILKSQNKTSLQPYSGQNHHLRTLQSGGNVLVTSNNVPPQYPPMIPLPVAEHSYLPDRTEKVQGPCEDLLNYQFDYEEMKQLESAIMRDHEEPNLFNQTTSDTTNILPETLGDCNSPFSQDSGYSMSPNSEHSLHSPNPILRGKSDSKYLSEYEYDLGEGSQLEDYLSLNSDMNVPVMCPKPKADKYNRNISPSPKSYLPSVVPSPSLANKVSAFPSHYNIQPTGPFNIPIQSNNLPHVPIQPPCNIPQPNNSTRLVIQPNNPPSISTHHNTPMHPPKLMPNLGTVNKTKWDSSLSKPPIESYVVDFRNDASFKLGQNVTFPSACTATKIQQFVPGNIPQLSLSTKVKKPMNSIILPAKCGTNTKLNYTPLVKPSSEHPVYQADFDKPAQDRIVKKMKDAEKDNQWTVVCMETEEQFTRLKNNQTMLIQILVMIPTPKHFMERIYARVQLIKKKNKLNFLKHRDNNNKNALYYAAVRHRCIPLVARFIADAYAQMNSSPDEDYGEDNNTLLHELASEGDSCAEVLAELLHATMPDKKKCFNVNSTNINTKTPLHIAAESHILPVKSTLSTTQVLISNGADLTIQDQNGCTPLHIALRKHCDPLFIRALLERPNAREYVNKKDNDDNTPLHLAATRNDISFEKQREVFLHLLSSQAKHDITNKSGKVALSLVSPERREELKKMLVRRS